MLWNRSEGGGQAGLAGSYYLRQHNRPHIVLEQADRVANGWRNHRWDSFTLNTPNWQSALPGAEIPDSSPDGFLSREEIVAYFENYVAHFQLPVRYGVHVHTVLPKSSGRGYVLETSTGRFEAINVVIATGLYQKPKIPALSADSALRHGYEVQEAPEMNLTEANIHTVIWATGYSFDFSFVQLPVFDDDGYPIQNQGVTDCTGLYFVGLPWLYNAKSGLLFGLAQDAKHIMAAIDEGSRATLDGVGTRTYYVSPALIQSREASSELSTSHS